MNLYIGKTKLKSKKISFYDLLKGYFDDAGYNTSKSQWAYDNTKDGVQGFIEVAMKTKKPSVVNLGIGFNHDKNMITSIAVHESDIIVIVDEENMRQIVFDIVKNRKKTND